MCVLDNAHTVSVKGRSLFFDYGLRDEHQITPRPANNRSVCGSLIKDDAFLERRPNTPPWRVAVIELFELSATARNVLTRSKSSPASMRATLPGFELIIVMGPGMFVSVAREHRKYRLDEASDGKNLAYWTQIRQAGHPATKRIVSIFSVEVSLFDMFSDRKLIAVSRPSLRFVVDRCSRDETVSSLPKLPLHSVEKRGSACYSMRHRLWIGTHARVSRLCWGGSGNVE